MSSQNINSVETDFATALAAKDPNQQVACLTEELKKANESAKTFASKKTKKWYPIFHIATPGGWLNDPNGLSYFKGQYHVYYQHHPYSTEWGPMHWGHVTSPDLVHWKHHPIVLAPSIEGDKDGVFSGSALIRKDEAGEDSELWAYYTGHRWRNGVDGEAGNLQVQCLATSKDGFNFEKRGTLINCPQDFLDFRDPKVWEQDGQGFMVLGVRTLENRGEVWLYRSEDLLNWQFDRVLYQDPDPEVFMLECPDFFSLGNHWVVAYCPMGLPAQGYRYPNQNSTVCVVGDWQPGTDFIPLTERQPADWGHNFYAPQTFVDKTGRRIQFGWLGTFAAAPTCQVEDFWCGQITVPRVLELNANNQVCAYPIPELANLHGDVLKFSNSASNRNPSAPNTLALKANEPASTPLAVAGENLQFGVSLTYTLDLAESSAERVYGYAECDDKSPKTALRWGYDRLAHTVFVERGPGSKGETGYRAIPLSELGIDRKESALKITVLLDRSSIEIFVQDGLGTLTSTYYPQEPINKISLLAEVGNCQLQEFTANKLEHM